MTRKSRKYKPYFIALLLCILQMAGIDTYAQVPVKTTLQDSIAAAHQAPQARARRHREDSLSAMTNQLLTDSLEQVNKANLDKLQATVTPAAPPPLPKDSLAPKAAKKIWTPNPTKATWLAVVVPGGGQIYNRKYWKLPIIYGGFAGCAYALAWNSKTYSDYSQAYLDIMDDNPNTNSFEDLLPPNYSIAEDQLKELLRKRKDTYRRYRDLSIFAFIGVYLISIIDAYVDAELSDFDITPELSMRVEPAIMNDKFRNGNKSVGVQCSIRF